MIFPLGETASAIRGENELWLAMVLRNRVLVDLKPAQLAAVCGSLVCDGIKLRPWKNNRFIILSFFVILILEIVVVSKMAKMCLTLFAFSILALAHMLDISSVIIMRCLVAKFPVKVASLSRLDDCACFLANFRREADS